MELTDGIYWGGDFNSTIELLESGTIDQQLIRFFIGYSGWTGGQLDTELKEKSWLVTTGVQRLVFPSNMKELWKDSLRHLGGQYEIMVNFPTDPQLN
jgi:putative transcriptional regulator